MYKIAEFIVTFCYIGKIKHAPGTWGSLAAFPIWFILASFCMEHQPFSSIAMFEYINSTIFFTLILLFAAGTYFTKLYLKHSKKDDPKEVVIDEVVGQLLTIYLIFPYISMIFNSSDLQTYYTQKPNYLFLLIIMPPSFLLFRLFDIVKPWPISWCDNNIKGAFGVMIDDILAAIFAAVSQYAIFFMIIPLFH